jgi:hypothetical protein
VICRKLPIVLVGLVLASCSSLNKLAVSGSSGLIYSSANNMEKEWNWDMFYKSVPANLAMMEGLLSVSSENEELLASLTKGYISYAYAIDETNLLEKNILGLSNDKDVEHAILNYTKGLEYGIRFLKLKKIYFFDLKKYLNDSHGLMHLLDQKINNDKINLETVLFIAQAYGSLINLQKDKMQMVAQLPIVKSLFDWVCMKNPNINYGACDLFYGTYYSGRPKMLGGDPEAGRDIFVKAKKKYPFNWLINTSFLEYYLIPQNDFEGRKNEIQFLKEMSLKFKAAHTYGPNYEELKKENWNQEEHLYFFQALAVKRFEILEKFKD